MTDPFSVNDRRGKRRIIVNESVSDAKRVVGSQMERVFGDTNPFTQAFSRNQSQDEVLKEMRMNRRIAAMEKRGNGFGGGGGYGGINGAYGSGSSVSFATGRPRDPLFYWRENNLPYDITKDSELKKIRAFCNTPEAPIWMGDYSFKPIGEVQVGDEVIGWEYNEGPNGQLRKKLVRTQVMATHRRLAPEVVRITMESGRVIRCTPDHMWANYYYSPTQGDVLDRRTLKSTGQPRNKPIAWKQPEYKAASVGSYLTSFIEPTQPLQDEKERLTAAWLSGIYDGEGSGNEIGQSLSHNPDVYRRIQESLDLLGLPHRDMDDRIKIQTHIGGAAGKRGKAGGQQALVDFLNWTNPVRRVKPHIDRMLLTRPSGGKDRVVSIESE